MFSVLTSKIFGALSLALLLLLAVKWVEASHWHKLADQRASTIAEVRSAQATAQAKAQAAHDAQEQRYKDLANAADKDHASALADAGAATDRYAATHRMQPANAACPARATPAPAQDRDTDVPASVPASGFVVISEPDLQACTGATVYAVEAHNHEMGLNP
jgi:hypothetical protein